MKHLISRAAVFLTVLMVCGQAQAADPRLIGNYSDWSAYVFMEGGNKVCYMASKPILSEKVIMSL